MEKKREKKLPPLMMAAIPSTPAGLITWPSESVAIGGGEADFYTQQTPPAPKIDAADRTKVATIFTALTN